MLSGQWILIGDPSGALGATVTGASAVYTYDPTNGYQQASMLQPGQGAWALGSGSGSITITPQTAAAASAASSLHTFNGQGFQIGVPAGWDRVSTGQSSGTSGQSSSASGGQPANASGQPSTAVIGWASADGSLAMLVGGPGNLPAGVPINAVRILTALSTSTNPSSPLAILDNGQVSSPAALITVQGADTAAEATFSGTLEGQAAQMTVILAIGNNSLYDLVIIGDAASATQNQALIQQLIQSFQLTSP